MERIARASRGLPGLLFFMPISGKPEIDEPKARPGFCLRGISQRAVDGDGQVHGARSGFGRAASQWLNRGARRRKSGRAGEGGVHCRSIAFPLL